MLTGSLEALVSSRQWFPTFLVSWTLLTIWLKAVDPLNKIS